MNSPFDKSSTPNAGRPALLADPLCLDRAYLLLPSDSRHRMHDVHVQSLPTILSAGPRIKHRAKRSPRVGIPIFPSSASCFATSRGEGATSSRAAFLFILFAPSLKPLCGYVVSWIPQSCLQPLPLVPPSTWALAARTVETGWRLLCDRHCATRTRGPTTHAGSAFQLAAPWPLAHK